MIRYGLYAGCKPDETMNMTLSDLNYCVIEATRRKREHDRDMIRLAWYTAYFMRVEKLGRLSDYLSSGQRDRGKKRAISPEEAKLIYEKLIGRGAKGGRNAGDGDQFCGDTCRTQ